MSFKSTLIPKRLNIVGMTILARNNTILMPIKFFTTGGIELRKEGL